MECDAIGPTRTVDQSKTCYRLAKLNKNHETFVILFFNDKVRYGLERTKSICLKTKLKTFFGLTILS